MPRICSFYGIAIYMYWDEASHSRPHFHAKYAGLFVSIAFNGEVLVSASHLSPSTPFLSITSVNDLFPVTAVEVIADYRLRLSFDDGTVGDVDFTKREWQGVFEPLRDPRYFAQVRVDHDGGTIVWPNGVDMAPEPLYELARRHPAALASPGR
jgi:hypothetical protein